MACKRSGVRAPSAPFDFCKLLIVLCLRTFDNEQFFFLIFPAISTKFHIFIADCFLGSDVFTWGFGMNLDDYRKSLLLRNYQPSTLKKNVQLAACFMRHVHDTKHINAVALDIAITFYLVSSSFECSC